MDLSIPLYGTGRTAGTSWKTSWLCRTTSAPTFQNYLHLLCKERKTPEVGHQTCTRNRANEGCIWTHEGALSTTTPKKTLARRSEWRTLRDIWEDLETGANQSCQWRNWREERALGSWHPYTSSRCWEDSSLNVPSQGGLMRIFIVLFCNPYLPGVVCIIPYIYLKQPGIFSWLIWGFWLLYIAFYRAIGCTTWEMNMLFFLIVWYILPDFFQQYQISTV